MQESATISVMEINPHVLHQIVSRIQEQVRCPQCGTPIPISLAAVKMAVDDFMLLQLKCGSCSTFIVLNVNMHSEAVRQLQDDVTTMKNVSSTISLSEDEMSALRAALEKSEGSFETLFAKGSTSPR